VACLQIKLRCYPQLLFFPIQPIEGLLPQSKHLIEVKFASLDVFLTLPPERSEHEDPL
jgi:hypothetical protein